MVSMVGRDKDARLWRNLAHSGSLTHVFRIVSSAEVPWLRPGRSGQSFHCFY